MKGLHWRQEQRHSKTAVKWTRLKRREREEDRKLHGTEHSYPTRGGVVGRQYPIVHLITAGVFIFLF